MKVGTSGDAKTLSGIPESARRAEDMGYDFFTSSETQHNPFLPLALAAEHTRRVALRTSIALAFARSPMDVAYISWDLQALSGGRLALGLGSQVRGHIVRRFNMPWGSPAKRMRDYVLALRAIWDSWQNGTKLDFQSEHYSFNLMPPFFNPGPIEHPKVKVYIAAVNPNMLRVAGELCDGVLLHSFNTHKYTKEVVLPNLEQGAAKSGRSLKDLDISGGGFIVTGANEEQVEANRQATKNRIAFYASTRSYAPVMNAHGWNDTAQKLYRMSVDGRWREMGREITDVMLEAFAVIGDYDEIVNRIKARYGSYASSIGFSIPVNNGEDEELLRDMIRRLQAG
ncbi:MAG: TIGR03617 family F420-dependent LLM class oxidoreductase [Chloroflexi bacterium]|nr:TIGR03617 family F420-dependent LLM class oxidoreductase [Chloroflexota bacterium]